MATNAFESTIEGIRSVWGPLSTDVVAGCVRHLERLVRAPATEEWLSALHREAPANRELYRDPAVKAAGAEKSRVKDIRAVRGREDNDAL